ncbi:hypothetical protein M0805_000562 [Coniferiporia weirii]|nr:hypothetical protein M0805_000562 [Coniferiporia weirii]
MTAGTDYDPAFEWPGVDLGSEARESYDASEPASSSSLHQRCLRLVVKSSTVLPRRRKVAVLDAYDEAQIGRDQSTSETMPRIRLKDMEVSKLHATLFWDREREEWAVVDMGSKHGTFLKPSAGPSSAHIASGSVSAPNTSSAARLSPSKQASMPRRLRHLDELSIGSTVFVAHVHPGIPCDDCISEGERDIPLFSSASNKGTQKFASSVSVETAQATRNPKKSISLLKKTLLPRHASVTSNTDQASSGPSRRYIDRSAKRRASHPYSRGGSPPGVSARSAAADASPLPVSMHASPFAVPGVWPADSSYLPSDYGAASGTPGRMEPAAPAPISTSNIGHRLLAKQGWVPGSSLGLTTPTPSAGNEDSLQDARTFLVEPLQVTANVGKRGIGRRVESASPTSGMHATMPTNNERSWKEDSKRRRWNEVR